MDDPVRVFVLSVIGLAVLLAVGPMVTRHINELEQRSKPPKSPHPSFTCPRCGAVSYNANDIRERYCGRCHVFVDDEARAVELLKQGQPGVVRIRRDEGSGVAYARSAELVAEAGAPMSAGRLDDARIELRSLRHDIKKLHAIPELDRVLSRLCDLLDVVMVEVGSGKSPGGKGAG
jgi:hypothetical protein